MDGDFNRTIEKDQKIDHKTSKSWIKNRKLTSHVEVCIAALQEQEIPTKYLINKRARDPGKEPPCNKSRLCKTNVEDVIHKISCCPFMPACYYPLMRHDMVAKTLCKEMNKTTKKMKEINEQEYIQKVGENEYWLNLSMNTAQKVSHKKPDLFIWNTKEEMCHIVKFSCPGGINITKKEEEKLSAYVPLIQNLQIMHLSYCYKVILNIVGALRFNSLKTKIIIYKMESISASGTAKICKSFLQFL